jgi:hypothetical protein
MLTKVPSHLPEQLNAKITNRLFLTYEILQSRLSSHQKIKIFFLDQKGWEPALKNSFKSTQYEITFGKLCSSNIKDYDLVVPLSMQDLKSLNKVLHLVEHNPIPIPSIESLLLCDDKYLLNQRLIDNGFGNFIPKMGSRLSYPYILKKSIDEWGKNSHVILDMQQEQSFTKLLDHPEYFSQTLVPGTHEYATHIIFKDQRIVCAINIEYGFKTDTPIKGKDPEIYRKVCSCSYLDVFSSILMSIGFEGLCCINYKVWNNRPLILEINPRFGGSLCPFFFSFLRHLDWNTKSCKSSAIV